MRRFYEAVKSGLHCNVFCTKSKMPVVTTTANSPACGRGVMVMIKIGII